jgi:hypothetical protein
VPHDGRTDVSADHRSDPITDDIADHLSDPITDGCADAAGPADLLAEGTPGHHKGALLRRSR